MDKVDFFISYRDSVTFDKQFAEWIGTVLEEEKYTVILQAWDFHPGWNFVEEMDDASRKADRTLALLSPDYFKSAYTTAEGTAAFAGHLHGEKGKLLPVRICEMGIEGVLGPISYIDLAGKGEEAARDILLKGVKKERRRPVGKVAFPKPPAPFPMMPAMSDAMPLRNPKFTGREKELAALQQRLQEGKQAALTQSQSLTGLGGVGKTQLALEYAYLHCADYRVIWWVRAETENTLSADLAALAAAMDLPEKDERDQRIILQAVRNWFQSNHDWLLILDNAPHPAKEFQALLPRGGGHIIVTSRDDHWDQVTRSVKVEVWPLEDAVKYLLAQTGETDVQIATDLARELGRLPLALAQAAAYMHGCGKPMAAYLTDFRAKHVELLRNPISVEGYDYTVATTWEISFAAVEKENPAAAQLLNLCGFFAPDDIPLDLLIPGKELFLEPLSAAFADPQALDEIKRVLNHYSLATAKGDDVSLHRLVQQVICYRMPVEQRKQWAEAAVSIVNRAFPTESHDVRTWPVCTRLLDHALIAADFGEGLEIASDATGRILNQLGLFAWCRAEFSRARILLERALTKFEKAYGLDHPNVAATVSNLGIVLKAEGDIEGAKKCYERALKIDEAAYGPEHPDVAIRVNNLGGAHLAQGDLVGAKQCFERAFTIFETAFGEDHPNVATLANNLGFLLQQQGDLMGAKQLFEKALRIDKTAFGPDHPDVAIDVINLGLELKAQGDMAESRRHIQQAYDIWLKFFGADHPHTKLAKAYLDSGG